MADTGTTYADVLATHKNKTVKEMWAVVVKEAEPLAEIQAKVKAASPPPVSELDKVLAESTDPEVVEFREQIKRLEDALRNAREDAHKHLLKGYVTISDDEMTELQKSYAAHANRVRKAVGMLRDYGELMGVEGVVEAVDQYRIPNLRGGTHRGKANVTNGGPRPTVQSCTIVRPDGKEKTDKRISVVAVWTKKLTPPVIYEAWFQATGKTQWQDINEPATFDITVEGEEKPYTVTIVPSTSDSEDSDESEE